MKYYIYDLSEVHFSKERMESVTGEFRKEPGDAKPTLLEKVGDNSFNAFSGRIGTCIQAVKSVFSLIRGSR